MKTILPISIVSVCDNHYIILLAALIKSIEQNYQGSDKIEYYIIEDRVSNKNKRKLENSINFDKIKLNWIEMRKSIPANIRLPSDGTTYPMNVYMRLFIPSFIPKNVTKVIYLDVDMIVQSDISSLWNTDLGNSVVAAAADPIIRVVGDFGGIENYADLGLDAKTKYFNSGLLIINIHKWLGFNIAESVIACINSNKRFVKFADQYGLNVVLADKWKELEPLWNFHAEFQNSKPFLNSFFRKKANFQFL
jgi:lipopolysaccharide biosynthesis glycosyltransferase